MSGDTVKITRLRASGDGARVLITAAVPDENGEPREVTVAPFVTRIGTVPAVGEVPCAVFEEWVREGDIADAISSALCMLAVSCTSRQRLVQKLRQKGYRAAYAEEAVRTLATQGYLEENENAVREAERGMRKLWGDRRILRELHAKGYTEEALNAAAARLESEDGAVRCATLLRRRRMSAPRDTAGAQKLFASLTRYGYTSTEIRRALALREKQHGETL